MSKFMVFRFFFTVIFMIIGLISQFSQAVERPLEETPTLFFPLCEIIPQSQLLDSFEVIRFIASGGEANAWEVQNKRIGNRYALIVEHEMCLRTRQDKKKELVEHLLRNQQYNPHIAKIYGYFWIRNPNYPLNVNKNEKEGVLAFKLSNIKSNHVLDNTYESDPNATPYRHAAWILELGLGNLESQSFNNLGMDFTTLQLSKALNMHSLYNDSILTCDEKERNYIYIETSSQSYNGKRMNEYDFWRYTIGSHLIYLPKQSHIIKRVDYTGWICMAQTEQQTLSSIAHFCQISKNDLIARFCQQPEGDIKILDLF